MAFIGPLDSFNSQPIQTKVGTSQTNIFTATSTKVEKDASGKVVGGTTTLYYSATAGNYVPAATTSDGGKTWTYLKDSDGKEILGADAKRSLETGALKNNTQSQIVSATTKPAGGLTPEQQKTVAASKENTASTTESGDNSSGDTEANQQQFNGGVTEVANITGSIKDNAKTRPVNAYGNLKYPLNLKSEDQDCIKFTMLSYSPKPLSSSGIAQGNPFGARTKMSKRDGGTVTLPIQPSITDSNNVQWNPENLNAGEAIAATAALSGIKGGPGALIESIKSGTDLLKNANPELKAAISAYFAGEAAGVKGLLTRTTGAIVNPNMELLFYGPQLRNFTFSFTMSAREPKEADEIKKIIRFFKQGMSVKRAATGLFLKTPHTFRIQYLHKSKEHPWINKIKECALTGCNVNYTPAGNYATYYDGSMTSYEISLSFGELEPIYDDDYAELVPGGNSDTHIGF